jgi:hypothetical protein
MLYLARHVQRSRYSILESYIYCYNYKCQYCSFIYSFINNDLKFAVLMQCTQVNKTLV